jgi:4-hydroxymandelate oxidase
MGCKYTRRAALAALGAWQAASPLLQGQETRWPRSIGEAPGRIAPLDELLNTFEIEAMAERKLSSTAFAAIAGGDRNAFDHLIFRPRRFINAEEVDLTTTLFGDTMYTPILVGPASEQQRFHPEGEMAMLRGASAVKTSVVISDRSGQPIEKIAGEAKVSIWYQIFPQADMAPVLNNVQRAVKAGCKVVILSVGAIRDPGAASVAPTPAGIAAIGSPQPTWTLVEQVRQAAKVPVVLKGVMSADEAMAAAGKGVDGVIVSNYGAPFTEGVAAPMQLLPSIVDAVGGKIPVLIDGSFRRGSDVVKALAYGARGVFVVRPALWGLAAYGSDGVQAAVQMIQGETARTMGLCGKPKVAMLDRTMIRFSKH